MPVYPVSDDDHIGAALNVARNPDPMGDSIQAKIGGLNQALTGLDLEANTPNFHTGIGGAGMPSAPLAAAMIPAKVGQSLIGDKYAKEQAGPFYRVYSRETGQARPVSNRIGEETWPSSPVDAPRGGSTSYGTSQYDPITGTTSPLMPTAENNVPLKAANKYVKSIGLPEFSQPEMPRSSLTKQSAIGRTFNLAAEGNPEYKSAIFDAYGRMMPDVVEKSGTQNYDQLLEAAYRQMAKETADQFDALPLRFSYHRAGEGDYKNSPQMVSDVHNNGHLFVYQGGDKHDFLHNIDPETGLNENEKFRAVHDAFGHAILGNTFGPQGEERAWGAHSRMYSPLAQLAMTAETRGQNSFVNYTPLNMKTFDQLGQIEMRLADAIKGGRTDEIAALKAEKAQAMEDWQFAPNKAVLLPPEFLSTDYAGGMPNYIRSLIRPEEGTTLSSSLAHFSRNPNMTMTDPSRYGTGLKGAERERLNTLPGGVLDRSYFYLGDPRRVSPEPGLGPVKYSARSENLYDWNKDPSGLWSIAQELNRAPATAKYDPAWINMPQAMNDVERLAKEYGYSGIANSKHRYPMAVMFDPTPVQRVGRKEGGDVRFHRMDGGRTLGNNAIDNAMRMALGGDAEIEMPHSLKELQDWKKTHPTPVSHSSMDNIFTNRVSGFEGAPPMAMPANLDELLAYLRRNHASGGRAHFEDGGDSGGGDSSSSDSSGNDNVRADSLSQNEQRSADTQAAIDKAISEAKSQEGTDVRTGDTPGGLRGDTGGSSGMISAAQGRIDAATAAAVDRAQQARELENRGTPDANVGGGSGDYMGNVKYTVADVNNIAKQVGGIYGVDQRLIQAMIKNESQYNPNAIGSAGEVGLMQVKPSTYMSPGYGVTPGTDVSNLANPYNNVDFAVRYLLARAGGADLSTPEGQAKALAAYNSSSTQDARDAYVKATQNAMGQTVSPEKMLGDVTINPANSGVYAALAKGVAQADATKTGAAEAGGAGPEARNLFTNRTTDATDTSSAIDPAKAAAVQPSIFERLFGSNQDQIDKLAAAGQYAGMDKDQYTAKFSPDNPDAVKERIIYQNGQPKVDYYTKDLSQAMFGDAGKAIGTGISNLFNKTGYDPTAIGNGMGNIQGVSSANNMVGPFDRSGHDQQMINNAMAIAAPTAPNAPVAPYTTQLSAGSLKLPSTTGQTAQQWADQNVGGDLSKVNARIKYVNGAPRLEYYTA